MDAFDRLAPYIQDYIYLNHWTELREVQVAACDVIFNTDNNLLLSSGTASGKTGAAFLPALTMLHEKPSASVGILYISPLKALINDQFLRLDDLLAESRLPVCKWHGDASLSAKKKLVKDPEGVLQITPESLESILINKQGACIRLFRDLRFVIIDEVHFFMGSPRGIQLLSQLERIGRLAGCHPRRIGLSATLGDYAFAETWLNTGTGRSCTTPAVSGDKRRLSLSMQRFSLHSGDAADSADGGYAEQFEFIYRQTLNKKAILFAKSKAEIEQAIAYLRQIAARNHTPDIYRVHHGSISALLREEAEQDMKTSDLPIVTGATVTLELGMDIGSLDRVVQIGSPFTASSFTQRIGRCGRKGQPAELLFTFLDNDIDITTDFLRSMNWEFLKTVAIIQLYLEEKWVEPIPPSRYPYALLYHQTMSFLVSSGEVSPAALAQNVLGLAVFAAIPQEDYKQLLAHLLTIGHIQKTERGGLIVGAQAERITASHEFYAVFESAPEYLVKDENQAIGTIMEAYPPGCRFALAGRSWETLVADEKSKVLFVKEVYGMTRIDWPVTADNEVHTRILCKMRDILLNDATYAYLSTSCRQKLDQMRSTARTSGFARCLATPLSGTRYAVFPWIGTRQLSALYYELHKLGITCSIQPGGYTPLYIELYYGKGYAQLEDLLRSICMSGIDKYTFQLTDRARIPCKYNGFVPTELLKKQFLEDYIDADGFAADIRGNFDLSGPVRS